MTEFDKTLLQIELKEVPDLSNDPSRSGGDLPDHPALADRCEADPAPPPTSTSGATTQPQSEEQDRPRTAVAYLRTASDESGAGLDAQRKAVVEWAREHALTIVEEFMDVGVSAHSAPGGRAGARAMLAYCKRNQVQTIVCTEVTRIARDHRILTTWMTRLARHELAVEFASGPQRPPSVPPQFWASLLDVAFSLYDCNFRARGHIGRLANRAKATEKAQHSGSASTPEQTP